MKRLIPLSEPPSPEIFSHTPEELVYQIFLHLPAVTATRCKVLSRAWRAHISNPLFAKSHFTIANTRTSPHPDDDHQTLVVHSYDIQNEGESSVFSIVDLNSRTLVPRLQFSYVRAHFPCKPSSFLVGCDAGIVCLYSTFSNASRMYMWNPLIGQHKRIPSYNIRGDDSVGRSVVFGFGYDSVGDDFKVVRVVPPSYSTEVYSYRKNAWQNIEGKPSEIPVDRNFNENFDVSVNGFLFKAGTYGMITFDLNTHVFSCIQFPAPAFNPSLAMFNTFQNPTRITEFHRSIAVIICVKISDDSFLTKFELWALNDESCLRPGGVEASWTRMFNVETMYGDLQFVHGHFNNGDFLQAVEGMWYLYNPNNHVAEFCDGRNKNARIFWDTFHFGEVFRYRKSLLSIA